MRAPISATSKSAESSGILVQGSKLVDVQFAGEMHAALAVGAEQAGDHCFQTLVAIGNQPAEGGILEFVHKTYG